MKSFPSVLGVRIQLKTCIKELWKLNVEYLFKNCTWISWAPNLIYLLILLFHAVFEVPSETFTGEIPGNFWAKCSTTLSSSHTGERPDSGAERLYSTSGATCLARVTRVISQLLFIIWVNESMGKCVHERGRAASEVEAQMVSWFSRRIKTRAGQLLLLIMKIDR